MTGLALNGKAINLAQLQHELITAGMSITGLGSDGTDVFQYDSNGMPADLPNGAAAVLAAHVPEPDAPTLQRMTDAATLLNSSAVRDSQIHRDAFARLINCQPLTIPLAQDAVLTDIHPL